MKYCILILLSGLLCQTPGSPTRTAADLGEIVFASVVSYRNETGNDGYLLQLPGHDIFCPFALFVDLTGPVIPDYIDASVLKKFLKYMKATFKFPMQPYHKNGRAVLQSQLLPIEGLNLFSWLPFQKQEEQAAYLNFS